MLLVRRVYALVIEDVTTREVLHLTGLAEADAALTLLTASCTHDGSIGYSLETVWIDGQGFERVPPPASALAHPVALESGCACRLVGAIR